MSCGFIKLIMSSWLLPDGCLMDDSREQQQTEITATVGLPSEWPWRNWVRKQFLDMKSGMHATQSP